MSDAVLERCGSHSGILHIGVTTAVPVMYFVMLYFFNVCNIMRLDHTDLLVSTVNL